MRATAQITKGQQVWNSYGERPNFDLLRSYGYIAGPESDVCEIPSNLVTDVAGAHLSVEERLARIDFLLDDGVLEEYLLDFK